MSKYRPDRQVLSFQWNKIKSKIGNLFAYFNHFKVKINPANGFVVHTYPISTFSTLKWLRKSQLFDAMIRFYARCLTFNFVEELDFYVDNYFIAYERTLIPHTGKAKCIIHKHPECRTIETRRCVCSQINMANCDSSWSCYAEF